MRLDLLVTLSCFLDLVLAQDLRAVLQNNENLNFLNSLLSNNTILLDELNGAQDITILAPSDDAWETLLAEFGPDFLSGTDFVTALLQYHVLDRRYTAANITGAPSPFIPTLLTNRGFVNITGGQVVHATRNSPSDTITLYSGYNTPSTINQSDIPFSSGYIHILSTPLTIPANITTTALAANLTSLHVLRPPTNDAFSRVGSALTDLSQDELHTIMMYHVINGTTPVYTSRIDHAEWISTTGTNVTWTYPIVEGETAFINKAAILVPNVLVANGVMHVMDNVLNPNGSATSTPTGTSGLPAYTAATSLPAPPFISAVTAVPTDSTPSTTPSVSPAPTASADTGTEDAASNRGISGTSFMVLGMPGVGTVVLVL